ncbi:hypothetical protein CHS0354_036107 [Potamilus streckersoni]|uniref:Uncharacterized protein n=1 Tax=Potamilus streckersoni TaxID=2493646 RepID=A0AAE0T3M2_9BIVA|nr:hypothetical protein CHS0354_036107 [Potamilus streckersoni]
MATGFRLIALDIAVLVLTILGCLIQFLAFFYPKWWQEGNSYVGMLMESRCDSEICVDKNALKMEGGQEWLFVSRLFEAFGVVFGLAGLMFAILLVSLKKKIFHTLLIYIHGAAALFIFLGDFIFLGCHKSLGVEQKKGSLNFPVGLCIVAGILCVAAAVVTGIALVKHLLTWDELEEDEIV